MGMKNTHDRVSGGHVAVGIEAARCRGKAAASINHGEIRRLGARRCGGSCRVGGGCGSWRPHQSSAVLPALPSGETIVPLFLELFLEIVGNLNGFWSVQAVFRNGRGKGNGWRRRWAFWHGLCTSEINNYMFCINLSLGSKAFHAVIGVSNGCVFKGRGYPWIQRIRHNASAKSK